METSITHAISRDGSRFSELDVVRLRFDTADEDTLFKAGTFGTIVHCYDGEPLFEVEFTEPVATVLTLGVLDILPFADAA